MENKAKVTIKKEVENLNLKQVFNQWWPIAVILIGIIIGSILISGIVMFYDDSPIDITWIILLLLAIIFILSGIGIGIWLVKIREQVVNQNLEKLLKNWEKLHYLYFENTPELFGTKYQLKFEGFIDSEDFIGTKALKFKLNGEEVVFSLSEDIEKRATKSNQTFYFLKYKLKTKSNFIKGYDRIVMHRKTVKQKYLIPCNFESQAFSSKYLVEGDNQLQVYKLFIPHVVSAYAEYKNFNSDNLELGGGFIQVNFCSGFESLSDYCPEIDNLGLIKWEKYCIIESLFTKIKSNFDFYLKAQQDLLLLQIFDN